MLNIVEGHLWKAQWKEKPNDEGHSKLTMYTWALNVYLGLEKVNGLKEARKERNSIPWAEYELEK